MSLQKLIVLYLNKSLLQLQIDRPRKCPGLFHVSSSPASLWKAYKQCREERSINGMALQGFVFKLFSVRAFYECDISCERELACQSYNYVFGENSCELNIRTKEARPEHFRSDPARVYLRRLSNRAPLGSIPELPVHSCQEIKASEGKDTISGKYWLDPTGNGTAVSVYCDMNLQDCNFDFEHGIDGWERTGTVFNNQPTFGDNPTARNRGQPSKHQGDWWIGGYENRSSKAAEAGAIQGDTPKGNLTSPRFRIIGRNLSFLIGGGCNITEVRAELLVNNKVVRNETGNCTETMHRKSWDVQDLIGQLAGVRLIDDSSDRWGHINFDDLKGDIICDTRLKD